MWKPKLREGPSRPGVDEDERGLEEDKRVRESARGSERE